MAPLAPVVLCGWHDSGTIPEFKLVTGVSTGALIAPFPFLGGRYYDRLRTLYTTIKPSDFYRSGGSSGSSPATPWPTPPRCSSSYRATVDAQMITDIAEGLSPGQAAADRHHEPRRAAPGDLEHRGDRRKRPTRGAGSRATRLARLGIHSGSVSAGNDRRRGRRARYDEMNVVAAPARRPFCIRPMLRRRWDVRSRSLERGTSCLHYPQWRASTRIGRMSSAAFSRSPDAPLRR